MNRVYRENVVPNVLSIRSLYTLSRRTFARDYRFSGETHDFYEVVCVLGGRVGITADKHVYVLPEGRLTVHPPNEFHKIWSDGVEAETVIFSFRAESFPQLAGTSFPMTAEEIEELGRIHRAAGRAFLFDEESIAGIREGRKAEACAVVKRLELFLLDVFSAEHGQGGELPGAGGGSYARIVSAMEHALGTPLRVDELARACNLSVSALEKTVRRYAGCGAMAYFNDLRMKRAAELLREGRSVKETADLLGFSCQNYFSLAFKKWAKLSPTAYRRAR